MLTLEDCNCPICMCIFIEPVTLPCKHTLCMPCFKHNVEETSLTCPLCRTRIATWSRLASKRNRLVDEKLWKEIQKYYPKKVQDRLDGKDDSDGDESANIVPATHLLLAEPGEIRKEYEAQLEQIQKERDEDQQREQKASETLIKQLQAEEMQNIQKRQEEMLKLQEKDEELARKLSQVITEAGIDSPEDVLMRESRSRQTRSASSSSTSTVGRSQSVTIESMWSKVKQVQTLDSPSICETNSKTSKSSSKLDICTPELPILAEFQLDDRTTSSREKAVDCDLTASRTDSSGSHVEKLTEYNLTNKETSQSRASVVLYDNNRGDSGEFESLPKKSDSVKPSASDLSNKSHHISGEGSHSDVDKQQRCTSAESNDSISVELSHFKPIKICPRTPPKRLPSGKIIEPPLIRTTPRNLSRAEFSSPMETSLSDIDASSPIMQRQLLSLAEERKHHVELMSKSTFTSVKGSNLENKNCVGNILKRFAFDAELGKKSNPRATASAMDCCKVIIPLPTTSVLKSVENENMQNSLQNLTTSKLIIPLEPKLDEFNISPLSSSTSTPSLPYNNTYVAISRSCIPSSSINRARHVSAQEKSGVLSPEVMCSPQRTIRDWVIKTNNSSCGDANPSPDLVLDTGRDEGDGDVLMTEKGECSGYVTGKNKAKNMKVKKMKRQMNTIHKFLSTVELQTKDSVDNGCNKNKQSVPSKHTPPRHVAKSNGSDEESVISSLSDDIVNRLSPSDDSDYELEKSFKHVKRKRKKCLRDGRQENRTRKQLKSLPCTEKTRKTISKSQVKHDYLASFCAKSISSNMESNGHCHENIKYIDQEEQDRLLALQLQKQFDLESKLNLTVERYKGGKDEYLLRKKCK